MQEQNLEEWKEKIDRSAEQITVPDTLTPGAVQQMLEERKNRTSAGRKEHRHYRRFAGIAAAVAVLVIAVGTYGWNKYGTDDAQPKKAALSVTETVDSTQDTEKKEQIGAFTLAKSYQDVYAAVQKNPIHKRSWQKAQWMICFCGRYRFCRGEKRVIRYPFRHQFAGKRCGRGGHRQK